jgi:hypothetical protein
LVVVDGMVVALADGMPAASVGSAAAASALGLFTGAFGVRASSVGRSSSIAASFPVVASLSFHVAVS